MTDLQSSTVKRCPRCKETQPRTEFNKSTRQGVQSYCKTCLRKARFDKKLARAGTARKRIYYKKWDIDAVLQRYRNGQSLTQLSSELNIPIATAYRYLKAEGIIGKRMPKAPTSQDENGNPLKWCKDCMRFLSATLEYFHKSPHATLGIQNICRACTKQRDRSEYVRERHKKWFIRQRLEALSHYANGDIQCACCGERHYEFLAIDHTNGGGQEHRKTIRKGGGQFVAWLKKQGWPEGYRVLCHNCNMALGSYGYCPHETSSCLSV